MSFWHKRGCPKTHSTHVLKDFLTRGTEQIVAFCLPGCEIEDRNNDVVLHYMVGKIAVVLLQTQPKKT